MIDIEILREMFLGQEVIISTKNTDGQFPGFNGGDQGICLEINVGRNEVDFHLDGFGYVYLTPETIAENSVEGPVRGRMNLWRKVQRV